MARSFGLVAQGVEQERAARRGRLALADATSTSDITAIADITAGAASSITIYVCVTCRGGKPLDLVPVPGELLAASTLRAAEGTGIAVRPVRCLANCNRGPSAAMRCNGSWTYVFGGLDVANAEALVEGARLLAGAADGILPWRGRPDILKRGLIARVPPIGFEGMDE